MVPGRPLRAVPGARRGHGPRSPSDLAPDELTLERAEELLAAPSGDRALGIDPDRACRSSLEAGRFGPYVQLGEAADGGGQAATASLFKTMALDTVTLDEALQLLRLPRVVGTDPADRRGDPGPERPLRAVPEEGHRHPKPRRRGPALHGHPGRGAGPVRPAQAAAADGRRRPLSRSSATDPDTKLPIVVRAGRFGPYVTDGETNASLRQGDDQETITLERAVELLADRRAAGPPVKRGQEGGQSQEGGQEDDQGGQDHQGGQGVEGGQGHQGEEGGGDGSLRGRRRRGFLRATAWAAG